MAGSIETKAISASNLKLKLTEAELGNDLYCIVHLDVSVHQCIQLTSGHALLFVLAIADSTDAILFVKVPDKILIKLCVNPTQISQ